MGEREDVERCAAFLRAVPVFHELDDAALRALAQHAKQEHFDPGQVIVAQGEDEVDKRFYVIRSGTADVVRDDGHGAEQIVGRLVCGSYFGELGLLTNRARNATVRVRGPRELQVYAFDALAFHEIIADSVLLFRMQRARREAERVADESGSGRLRLQVRDVELIRSLPEADRSFVMAHSEQRTVPTGTTIFHQGDVGDRFYMLLAGAVRVVRDGVELAVLQPGDFFGETALLLDMPRTATIQTIEPATTWSITRQAFQRIVGHRLLANHSTQATIMQRMQSVAARLPERGEAKP